MAGSKSIALKVAIAVILAVAATGCTTGSYSTAYAPAYVTPNCREFKNTVIVDDRPQEASGFACQQADGSWKVAAPGQVGQPPQVVYLPEPPPYYVYPRPYYGPRYYSAPYYGPGYYGGPMFGFGIGTSHRRYW